MPTIWGEIHMLENALENVEYLLSCNPTGKVLAVLNKEKAGIEKRLNQLLDKAYEEERYVDKMFKEE